MSDAGHNSGAIAADHLRSLVERIERLEEEKATITADIKEVYAEAKGTGFDTATIRQIVKLRKLEPNDRQEREELLDIYKRALGMLDGTPLGLAALERVKADAFTGAARSPRLTKAVRGFLDSVANEPGSSAELRAGGNVLRVVNRDGVKTAEVIKGDAPQSEESIYAEAVAIVRAEDKASISLIQRRLGLGYNAAARLLERMESENIVSVSIDGRRDVLPS